MATFVLVHSPLVGPGSWSPVQRELTQHGVTCIVPELTRADSAAPFWQRDALAPAEAVANLPADESIVLVGHSGAGFLLPAVRQLADRPVSCYVFVDAEIPNGHARADSEGFRDFLQQLYDSGRSFPNWTDAGLTGLIPDASQRRDVLAEMRPQPWEFWDEPVPIPEGWPDAPCAFLRLPAGPDTFYDGAADKARALGWPYDEVPGGHFAILTQPAAVADALITLASRSGVEGLPAVIPPFR